MDLMRKSIAAFLNNNMQRISHGIRNTLAMSMSMSKDPKGISVADKEAIMNERRKKLEMNIAQTNFNFNNQSILKKSTQLDSINEEIKQENEVCKDISESIVMMGEMSMLIKDDDNLMGGKLDDMIVDQIDAIDDFQNLQVNDIQLDGEDLLINLDYQVDYPQLLDMSVDFMKNTMQKRKSDDPNSSMFKQSIDDTSMMIAQKIPENIQRKIEQAIVPDTEEVKSSGEVTDE